MSGKEAGRSLYDVSIIAHNKNFSASALTRGLQPDMILDTSAALRSLISVILPT